LETIRREGHWDEASELDWDEDDCSATVLRQAIRGCAPSTEHALPPLSETLTNSELLDELSQRCLLGIRPGPDVSEHLRVRPRHSNPVFSVGGGLVAQVVEQVEKAREHPERSVGAGWARNVLRTLVESVRDKTRQAAEALLVWLEVQGFKSEPSVSLEWFRRFIVKSFHDFVADEYEVRNKYICASMQSVLDYERTAPPVPAMLQGPDGEVLDDCFLGGAAYVWFATRTREPRPQDGDEYRDRRLALLNSLTGYKKAQPEVSRATVRRSVDKWGPALFRERQGAPQPDAVDWAEYRGVVREIVGALGDLRNLTVPVPCPSTAARLHSMAKLGGALGEWVREVRTSYGLLGEMGFSMEETIPARSPDEARPYPSSAFLPHPVMRARSGVNGDELVLAAAVPWVPLFSLLRYFGTELAVSPVGLPEPFKVRVISKGPTMPYWVCQVLQKAIHTALQKLPEFRLTRETPDRDITSLLTEVLGTAELAIPCFNVSGDYTAATDNLHPGSSEIISEELSLAMGLSDELSDLFKRALTGHVLHDPERELHGMPFEPQRWGQLMGSNVSFPVLCIANLAMTILALRRAEGLPPQRGAKGGREPPPDVPRGKWGRRVGRSGILINGDDIGFQAGTAAIREWTRITTRFGLSPSVGKNFVSREFIQLNSKMFRVDFAAPPVSLGVLADLPSALAAQLGSGLLRLTRREWRLVPTASLAVLCPPRRVTAAEFFLSAPEWQRTFLAGSEGAEADRLNSIFIEIWSPFLRLLPTGLMNWFVPRSLGGFGLRATRPVVLNEPQSHAAAWFRDNTSPETERLARLRWETPDARTTTRAVADRLLRELQSAGVIRWDHLPFGSEPISTAALEQAVVLTGLGVPIPPASDGVRKDPDLRGFGVFGGMTDADAVEALRNRHAPVERGPAPGPRGEGGPPATERGAPLSLSEEVRLMENTRWYRESVRLLKKASTSTSRKMSLPEIEAFVPRAAGWVWNFGFVDVPCKPVRVQVSDVSIVPEPDILIGRPEIDSVSCVHTNRHFALAFVRRKSRKMICDIPGAGDALVPHHFPKEADFDLVQ
jgi:hypothetical protein